MHSLFSWSECLIHENQPEFQTYLRSMTSSWSKWQDRSQQRAWPPTNREKEAFSSSHMRISDYLRHRTSLMMLLPRSAYPSGDEQNPTYFNDLAFKFLRRKRRLRYGAML